MIKKLGFIFCLSLLSGCCNVPTFYCCNQKPMCPEQYARCQELERRMMYNTVTTDSLVAAQLNAELDAIHREYRLAGC